MRSPQPKALRAPYVSASSSAAAAWQLLPELLAQDAAGLPGCSGWLAAQAMPWKKRPLLTATMWAAHSAARQNSGTRL